LPCTMEVRARVTPEAWWGETPPYIRVMHNGGSRPARGWAHFAPALGAGLARTGSQAIRWGFGGMGDVLRLAWDGACEHALYACCT